MKLLLFLLVTLTIMFITGCQSDTHIEFYEPKTTVSSKQGEPLVFGPVKSITTKSGYRESVLGQSISLHGSAM